LLSYLPVAKVLKFYFVCCSTLFGNLQHIVASIGETLKGASQSLKLLWGSIKFARNCFNKLHINIDYITLKEGGQGAFLPRLKAWASCA
jgi:hypothetical protein